MPENPLHHPTPADAPPMSPNQLVSYNLLRARRTRGWKQQELGEMLGRYTGRTWSNASVSAAERAWQGGRPRKFDADEIAAFCQIFDVPFTYFLLPPEDSDVVELTTAEEEKVGPFLRFPIIEYLRCVLAVDPAAEFVDRAQASVVRYASLDFIPAKWEWDVGRPGASSAAPAGQPSPERSSSRPATKDFTRWVEEMNIPDEIVDALTQARSEQVADQVARRLDAMGYIRDPHLGAEMERLRERVSRLMERLEGEDWESPSASEVRGGREVPDSGPTTVGGKLARARVSAGLTTTDVAKAIGLKPDTIRAMEQSDWGDVEREGNSVRDLITIFARAVNLDPRPLLDQFARTQPPRLVKPWKRDERGNRRRVQKMFGVKADENVVRNATSDRGDA